MKTKKLNVALIGCGAVSRNHGKALLNNEYATLRYIVDINRDHAEKFQEKYGGEILSDYRELYEKDVDVVHVITPHYTHPEIVIDMLERGFDVLTEKPIAIDRRDGVRMIDKSEELGRRLGVCFQNRLNKATKMAKEIIDDKRYGNIVSMMGLVGWDRSGKYYSESPWRGTYEREGGGTIINQSIHTIDLMDYLSGGISEVSAFDAHLRENTEYEVDDFAMAYFKFNSGATGVGFFTNAYEKSKICDVEIHLEGATLLVQQRGLTITHEDGKREFFEAETLTGEKSEWGVSHSLLINEFYRSILEDKPFIADAKTALRTTDIVNAIHNSNGRFIKVRGYEKV